MKTRFNFKMNVADPAPADGGAGGGILDAPPAAPAPSDAPPAYVVPEWLSGVDPEFASSDIMKNVPDLPTLAKNYVHAQKMVGSDKVALPSKHATPDEWKQFFNKAGLPETIDKYDVNVEGAEAKHLEDFKAQAFELGLMPHQAEALFKSQHEASTAAAQHQATEYEQIVADTVTELKTEYGQAYDAKIIMAGKFLDEVADEGMRAYIKESGLDSDGTFIKMLVNAATKFGGEGKFNSETNPIGSLTPEEAQSQINTIFGDPKHPYMDSSHPNHANAAKEMQKLFEYTV